MTTTILAVLAITSLAAATVNAAFGYGYSSISVPIALLVRRRAGRDGDRRERPA